MLQLLIGILSRHTSTPEDCFFGLWDGFAEIYGSPPAGLLRRLFGGRGARETPPAFPPAFPPEVLSGPRVRLPARDYLLFRGPLSHAGEWGAADLLPGEPRPMNSPNLIWPADHAWFISTDIDLPWTGVGGSAELIQDLKAEKAFDIKEAEPTEHEPVLPSTGSVMWSDR